MRTRLIMADNLKSNAFLSGFDAPERETLVRIAKKKKFAAGKSIFREGEEADGFYVIETGLVSLDYTLPNKRHIQIQQLGTGEVLGTARHESAFGIVRRDSRRA